MTEPRAHLTEIQTAALKHLAMCCCNNGGSQVDLGSDNRAALDSLWRRALVEIWSRHLPGEKEPSGPFYRPTHAGWALIREIVARPVEVAA
jgi:hypothetical protein